jgi:hypothetical protein
VAAKWGRWARATGQCAGVLEKQLAVQRLGDVHP